MSSPRSQLLAKALKLRELSIRGIGGEKDNATRMLADYRVKHNITDHELYAAGEKGTEANSIFEKYSNDKALFDEFIKEFFGPAGGALILGVLKIVTMHINTKY